MRYGFKIALRYLTSNLAQTGLLVFGVAVAVFIFIFMSALIGGLADLMVNRTLGSLAHVTVAAEDPDLPLLDTDTQATVLLARQKSTRAETGIIDAAPFLSVINTLPSVVASSVQIKGAGVLVRGERVRQVSVTGLAPKDVTAIIPFETYLQRGTLELSGDGLLIGATLAADMNLSIDSPVTLRTNAGVTTTLRVTGIFFTGAGQVDSASAYINIGTARSLFNIPNAVSRIELKLTDLYDADRVAKRIEDMTGLDAEPWTEAAEQLYEGLKAQSNTGLILKSFALVTIVIGVASSLMLSTYRRRPEIGIMRAMGASQGFILFVFVMQGSMIGLLGGVFGSVLGLAVLTPLTPDDIAKAGQLPIDVAQGSIGLAIVLTAIGATLAALLPARAASRIDPVEAIGQ
ncbi:ABC transporter permease [Celeribacter sp.]|uniref:ABC transporter permease n=1 Tax=Celeribacter sp. TaxID=1890673 RepID=UPI003A95B574